VLMGITPSGEDLQRGPLPEGLSINLRDVPYRGRRLTL
jgi:hypothetical protein